MKKIIICLFTVCLLNGCSERIQYIDESFCNNDFSTCGKINGKKDYFEVIDQKDREEFEDPYAIINHSSNDFYNWITNYDIGKEKIEHLWLNLNGEFAREINKQFDDFFQEEQGGFVATFLSGYTQKYNDILSLTLRTRTTAGGGMYKYQMLKEFNISLTNNSPISNEELLSKYNLDFTQAQLIIDNQLIEDEIQMCSNEISSNCYNSSSPSMPSFELSDLSPVISNNSFLFVDETGNLFILIYVNELNITMYDGGKTDYYLIQLNQQ